MKVKNQHYVPRFYLNFFSNNSKIWCLDKTNSKQFETNINNIASENYFYDNKEIDELTGEQTLEKTLNEMETDLAPRLKKFISKVYKNKENFSLTKNDKILLSEFIVMQSYRTPESKNSLLQIKSLFRDKLPLLTQGDESFDLAENHSLFLLKTLSDEQQYIEMFNKIWIIYIVKENLFYTCDSPVCGYVHEKMGFDAYQIFMPLTPRIIITALAREPFKHLENIEGNLIELKDDENIAFYNEQITGSSFRFIYSKTKNFNIATQMIKEHPELQNPLRSRFNIT